VLAEGASQKPLDGSEHAARSNPMTAHGESLGRFVDMAHQGGAFKVNSGIRFMHCPTPPVCPRQHRFPQCRNFSQIADFAHQLYSLPIKHTFFSPKNCAIGLAFSSAGARFFKDTMGLC
jgi:hypothetical protein